MNVTAAAVLLLVAIVALATGARSEGPGGPMPIVGILGKPVAGESDPRSYFVAFYPKWLEQAGLRVVPLPYDLHKNATLLETMVAGLSGVLFTGGDLALDLSSDYVQTAKALYDRSVRGGFADPFPVWGTCMGFQLLHVLAAWDDGVLTGGYNSWDVSLPLDFEPGAESAKLFSFLGGEINAWLRTENITMNFHRSGVEPGAYLAFPKLAAAYEVLTTNRDLSGKPFVSTIQGKNAPIFGTQWHPERSQYEFNNYDVGISHTLHARIAMAMTAQFFGTEAAKSRQSLGSWDIVDRYVIYNLDPDYSGFSTQTYHYTLSSFENGYKSK